MEAQLAANGLEKEIKVIKTGEILKRVTENADGSYTPVFGDAIDLQRLGEIGKKGVLALMSDSTNAEKKGFTMSEKTVGKKFDSIFAEHSTKRIIVATFASNVDRVQQIIKSAVKYKRKVVVVTTTIFFWGGAPRRGQGARIRGC